jgi:hypothetical protein
MDLPKKIKSLASNQYTIPVVLLVVTVLAYGLAFWKLGLYWDDQPISWIRYQLGSKAATKYFSDSRPVWGLLYQLTANILPLKPAYWQLFAMFWRWAGAIAFWLVLQKLFPRRNNLAMLVSFLFLLYPGFNQEWVSYLYSHFFIVLFFLLISLHLMLRGKTIPAMIFSALNLLMFEYFFLLELIRPFIIFKSLQDESMTTRERYIKSLKIWFPYILVIILVVFYRSLVFSHPGFGYSLLDELARDPAGTSVQLVLRILSGLWAAAVGAWLQAFQFPTIFGNGIRTSLLYAVVVTTVGVVVFFLHRLNDSRIQANDKRDALWLVSLGALMLALGGVPFWVSNLPVSLGFPANRATLSLMLGACFLLMGLIEFLPKNVKYLVAILLISLSAGRQFLWSVDYMRDWESQKNFFWQMTWRAPGLEPGTMVLTNEELKFSADNSLSAALNWIYAPDNHSDRMDYVLFYPTNRIEHSLPRLEPDLPIQFDYVAGQFHGNTSQTVVFYYSPPGCLRLLDGEIDSKNHLIPDETMLRDAAALSSSNLILSERTSRMPGIYFPEPAYGWCYYFERADLARQQADWEEVVRLGDIAFDLSDHPNDPVERFVFIEGYAHVGDWARAQELSVESYRVSKEYVAPMLCSLWARIGRTTQSNAEQMLAVNAIREKFACSP